MPPIKPDIPQITIEGYHADKEFWRGTQRMIPPEETLENIRPYFKSIGLTRLANITGLDRIGIPIVLSVRPNGGYLTVDAGKGITVTAAAVSAAMEAIERFHAETLDVPTIRMSYAELLQTHPAVARHHLPLTRHSLFNEHVPEVWSFGWDMVQQQAVAVPEECVVLIRHRHRRSLQRLSFQTGSNGLASGNHVLEAIAAGLYEVIERDALACHRVAVNDDMNQFQMLDLTTIKYPVVLDLLEQFQAAGVKPYLFDCSLDTDVPVYMAYIADMRVRHIGLYRGYGAHLDPEIAMTRALTEAAQSRLVFISGSRDDMFSDQFRVLKKLDNDSLFQLLERLEPKTTADVRHSQATNSFEGDIQVLIAKLKGVGLEQVIVYDFTPDCPDFSVVRVIVPGLEGYLFKHYTPGERALRFLKERQTQQ